MKNITGVQILAVLILLYGFVITGCKNDENPVFDYLKNSELQYEGKTQEENIVIALNDILNLSEEQLKTKRYKNYAGKENQWDLPTLIRKHFVPNGSSKFLGKNFYHNIKSKKVQKEIKEILEQIK